ncbi:uncharacterized protein LOC104883537 [Beta vulgaris subsp. vulgaris]|uniref:uncharacterized protein LOC104883537 n=1 Tax=Beta vulgaris subsp. vulgaris TaxID=3555 RepID=UPI00053FC122|nr:uncharacterized protein LOC104883537 [Beta vulgaris subsp. vulgaris]
MLEDDPARAVAVGMDMDPEVRTNPVTLLRENANVFAFSADEMPGIDPAVMVHRLNFNMTVRPVKQKKRAFSIEKNKAIKEEVEKLIVVSFIEPCDYPEWLANVVMVKKANGQWRIQGSSNHEPPGVKRGQGHPEIDWKNGRLDKFISKSADKALPFFTLLRGNKKFEWGEEQSKAFLAIKEHQTKLPIISRLENGDTLQLYISTSLKTVAAVLLVEKEKQQHPIYFVSHILNGPESRYQLIEKIALAVVIAARKLRPYFDCHPIQVLTNQPFEKALQRTDTSGHLLKWAVELSEYDIQYRPQTAIKAQALADFITEAYEEDEMEEKESWLLEVDGSSAASGAGAGIVITCPEGNVFEYAIKIHSWLAANLEGEFESREANMIKYVEKSKEVVAQLEQFGVEAIPRAENIKAHALSKLASSDSVTIEGMVPTLCPIPFAQWGMDILGPFTTPTGGRRFLIMGIDYFTKWIEAEPTAKKKANQIKKFIWQNMMTRFGIPAAIVFDHGVQFDCRPIQAFLTGFQVKFAYSAVCHPQSNGQAEAANKQILNAFKKKLDEFKGKWAEMVPAVLWANRTTEKEATGESPFRLTFGAEAVLPVEVRLPTYQIKHQILEKNDQALRENFDFLPELRLRAELRAAMYKDRISKAYNKRVMERPLAEGELVLRRTAATGKAHAEGKLSANWEGSYVIARKINPGSFILKGMDGRELKKCWNADVLKKYYV